MKSNFLIILSAFAFGACAPVGSGNEREEAVPGAKPVVFETTASSTSLSDYWYQGKAEVTSYELLQNRYNNVHPGEAVMIFVTEDFLTDKLVKNDNYVNPNSVPILKNNMVRNFPTGLYDYSLMTSVFTPVNTKEQPVTLKISSSSQEWCGHTYMQVNRVGQGYNMTLHSYFENEADKITITPTAIFEDELYNRIRMNPQNLPIGNLEIFPSLMVVRLRHLNFEPLQVKASLSPYEGKDFKGKELMSYSLTYPAISRQLDIVFENLAPYKIVGWRDAYPSAFDGQERITLAKRKKTIMSPYWQQNGLEDMKLRKELQLDD